MHRFLGFIKPASESICLYTTDSSVFHVTPTFQNTCFKMSDRLPVLILLLVIGNLLLLTKNRKKLNTKKKWAKRWLIQRNRFSNSALLKELKTNEPCDYRNYLHMDDSAFYYLVEKICPRIEKRNSYKSYKRKSICNTNAFSVSNWKELRKLIC